MIPHLDQTIPIVRRRERLPDPLDYRVVRRSLARDELVRIAPGTYARSDAWRTLTPLQRHRARVVEAAGRMRRPAVFACFAAAALWGIDILGAWPTRIDMFVESAGGGRSTGLIRRRARALDEVECVAWGEHFVTSPAQTAVDLAAELGFTAGVVLLDQALWRKRPGGPLATRDRLDDVWTGRTARGRSRAAAALAFATDASDSVRESHSRVLIDRLGFPKPVLQHPIRLRTGATAFPDFFWPEHEHAGEFDGTGKYLDPALLSGRTPAEALLAEKDRGDELRRAVRRLSRWRTRALREPRELYDILSGDGLRSSKPRPAAAARWD